MAIAVFDDFNRPDNPTSLGTATTGQVWVPYDENWNPGDTRWGIHSNQGAREAGGNPSVGGGGFALVETELVNCIVKVTIGNAAFGGDLNNNNFGIIFRWQSALNYEMATWSRAGKFLRICQVVNGNFLCTNEGFPGTTQIQDGDVIEIHCCDTVITGYLNGELRVTGSTLIGSPGGTMCGLQCGNGVISDTAFALFDDFTVETNATCPGVVTYNCVGGACIDPGDGSGTYATLAACLAGCGVDESYNCVDGVCVDPGDGSGAFPTLLECELSGCTPRVAETQKFDAGNGSEYYLVAQIDDDGSELRSKTYKSIRATGIRTNASAMMYGYDVQQEINVDDLELGTRSNTRMTTRPQDFTDSTGVTQSERKPINVANAVLGTVRYEGNDTGNEQRDRIDEIVIERAIQGVRR